MFNIHDFVISEVQPIGDICSDNILKGLVPLSLQFEKLKIVPYHYTQMDLTQTSTPLLVTPNRFTRTSQSACWNTGNGSPDAIAFSVDKSGIVIAGVCVYGGAGQYQYELELLDDVSSFTNNFEKSFGPRKSKGLNRIANIRENNLS